jgi:thiol:disulfide interchange protein
MKTLRRVLASGLTLSFLSLPLTQCAVAQMAPPLVKAHLYDENADPRQQIAAAVAKARREHKRVIVDFGGDWCGDCQVLNVYFEQPQNKALLDKYYVLVDVSVGHIDKNLDVPQGYGVNIKKGVPALAVLDSHGRPIYAQATGEFENMRNMNSSAVTEFLNKWKA